MADVIQKIQFKRGTKENLEAVLVGANKPANGEPIYETGTGKVKIGNGVNDYKDLPYLSGGSSIQQLVYDSIYEFPTVGAEGNFYIVKNGNSYRWDSELTHYVLLQVDNRQFYGLIYDENNNIIGAERQINAGGADLNQNQYLINDYIH